MRSRLFYFFFFFNDTATTEIYTLSLHDALPISRDGDEALGVPTFRVDPTLLIVRPPQNALTNDPTPAFTLTYGAQCNGEPCPFANDYFAAYQLSATLNAQPIGAQFAFHASAAEATFTPVTRLPEGQNSFSAQVTDRFGHQSSREAITFMVDTIPPKFLTLAPADGSVPPAPRSSSRAPPTIPSPAWCSP